jgi:ATP-binding cassette subfamily B protein
MSSSARRSWFVPEVVQTSGMDCGPAVLAAALKGFGIQARYDRLREACQTDVDGTSIDMLEQVAVLLGLDAEQVMVPADHLLLPEAQALPALLVVRLPTGVTHFVLVWRTLGPFVQVMDPGVGRRWMLKRQLLEEVHVHKQRVPAAAWSDWARGPGLLEPLAARLRDLGLAQDAASLIDSATQTPGWLALARLDAATRLVTTLVQGGSIRAGREARGVLRSFLEESPEGERTIPEACWSVRPAPAGPEGEEQLLLKGAVLVRLIGKRQEQKAADGSASEEAPAVPSELAAALIEPEVQPGRELLRLGRGLGRWFWLLLAGGLVLTACATVLEAGLLRGVFELGRLLSLVEQRLLALSCLAGFGVVVLLLELGVTGALVRLGRRLELRLRAAFLEKLPRLHDRYFQSRMVSDMADRSHSLHSVRLLPRLAGRFVRAAMVLALTVGALAWIDPLSLPLTLTSAALALGLPLALLPLLQNLDLRARTHGGALSRFYMDVLVGLTAVRAHGAERSVRREHESLLVEWVRASRRLLHWVVILEGLQATAGFGLAGWLLFLHASRVSDAGSLLLLAYWALQLPVLGQEIALLVRQYPLSRNVTLRLLEPLTMRNAECGMKNQDTPDSALRNPHSAIKGAAITLDAVTVRAGGHTILEDVRLDIAAGSHVAIVGTSGAGKSTLLGLLLGWHRAAAGSVCVDDVPLDTEHLDRLRQETAWVDPSVQLWNASLLYNLLYGADPDEAPALGSVVEDASLTDVLRRLPEGLQTPLGEGGGLLSGGQGQRVRLGRALVRSDARLVLLDEPFRGLDREQRRGLLRRARQVWRDSTLLCVTHDVGETREFERVLVIESGRVVEDGCPADLMANPGSRYRELLEAETQVRTGLWASSSWRRLRLEDGHLNEAPPTPRTEACTGCRRRLHALDSKVS